MKRTIKNGLAALLVGAAIMGIAQLKETPASPSSYEVKAVTIQKPDALDRWLSRLAEKECNGCGPHFRHLDTNGKWSYSCLQFQEATFKSEIRRYKILPAAEDAEIMNFIYDCQIQKLLARKMIEADPSAWIHWKNSVQKIGLPPRAQVQNQKDDHKLSRK